MQDQFISLSKIKALKNYYVKSDTYINIINYKDLYIKVYNNKKIKKILQKMLYIYLIILSTLYY